MQKYMKVFIENEAGSDQKNLYNEKTLKFRKAVAVSRKYPYPYGFILDTTSGDGDNVDVFIITDKALKTGEIVECEPVSLMEQMEKSWDEFRRDIEEVDHNVLAVLSGEDKDVVNDDLKARLTDFVEHVFDHVRPNKNRVGEFLSKEEAIKYVEGCRDK
jgi:inorganic pyrophosphatase